MRVAVLPYRGVNRDCYAQLIGAALSLAKDSRMLKMARWDWGRFSQWLLSHPFEMDNGCADKQACATECDPPQRMRTFPATMNCWERSLHQLAWFAARGAERATLYDHDTLVGRHIEVLVPPTTYLGVSSTLPARGPANGAADQAIAGILGGLQGGLQGAGVGAAAGPCGALAGFIVGAGIGAAKGALERRDSPPSPAPSPPTPPPPAPQAPAPVSSARAPPEIVDKPSAPLPVQLVQVLGTKPQPEKTVNTRVPTRTTKKQTKKKQKKKE